MNWIVFVPVRIEAITTAFAVLAMIVLFRVSFAIVDDAAFQRIEKFASAVVVRRKRTAVNDEQVVNTNSFEFGNSPIALKRIELGTG